jgi:tetratricopeptide (TPR) repeat protein
MLAMAAGNADVEVPPTLKALLTARLDQLEEAERRVLERGSIEGEIFHRGGVQALTPEETQVTTRLATLVRRQLVRPDRAQLAGDDGYRFRHLLIRDAAYDSLPKATRADLHARFALWLDALGSALVERDEIVGYHLGQAARYRAELGQPDRALAERAAGRLATAGRRAIDRLDYRTAVALLTRAAELTRPHRLDLALELERVWAMDGTQGHERAGDAEAAAERAEAEGDRSGAMLARALALVVRTSSGELDTTDEQERLLVEALPFEKELGDHRRLALLWEVRASVANFQMQNDAQVTASEHALRQHRLAGDSPTDTQLEWGMIIGPRPADRALEAIDELAAVRPPGTMDLPRSALLAMLGRLDEAWPLAEASSSHLREVAGDCQDVHVYLWLIAMIAGDRERAVRHNTEMLDVLGSSSVGATFSSTLARLHWYLGRVEEAEPLLRRAQAVPPRASMRVMGPSVEALLLAARGELDQAQELARTAVTTAETETDSPWFTGWALEDLATVLERAGRAEDAREALERALAVWERKRCLPCAERAQAQIDSLGLFLATRQAREG